MSVNAYVLVVGDVGMAPQIVEAASKIAGVKSAQSITGAYDVIVAVEARDTALSLTSWSRTSRWMKALSNRYLRSSRFSYLAQSMMKQASNTAVLLPRAVSNHHRYLGLHPELIEFLKR